MQFIPFSLFIILSLLIFTAGVRSAGLGPGRRAKACTASYNNVLYVWGGASDATVPSANFTSTKFPIKQTSITWTDLSWDIPSSMADKSKPIDAWPCVVSPKGILVVGGVNLFGYDLVANKYVVINATGGNPLGVLKSRTNVRAAQVDDALYYFGGYVVSGTFPNETSTPEPELFVLNLTTWAWEVRAVNNLTSIPPNYDGSTMVYGGSGSIYMFGGSRGTSAGMGIYYSNIYRYDMSSATWSQIPVSPGAWKNGFDSAAGAVFGPTIYLFGGGSSMAGAGKAEGSSTSYFLNEINIFQVSTSVCTTLPGSTSDPNAPNVGAIMKFAAIQNDAAVFVGAEMGYPIAYLGNVWIFNFTTTDWAPSANAGPSIQSPVLQKSASVPVSASASASASGTPSSTPNNGPGTAVIAGSVVAGVVVLGAVAALFARRYFRRKHTLSNVERDHAPSYRPYYDHSMKSERRWDEPESRIAVEHKPDQINESLTASSLI